ncbi:hypothetical protein [Hungatella sp.]|uniref:N-acetylmuramoyl-L-alanine amidase family protein n=1 Tax=Hungatella sp. TaxID=2613924 RepID=UPI0032E48E65
MDGSRNGVSFMESMRAGRIIKKGIACLLAFVLAFLPPVPGLTMSAMAAGTELQPAQGMKENGGGLTTAYKWNQGTAGKFDIEGIEDASLIGSERPYTGDRLKAVITTYAHQGYETVVQKQGGAGGRKNVAISVNGGIQTFDDLGIEVQMKVYPSLDQKWILVDYIVYNKKNENNPIQIASGTDVQVGGRSGAGAGDPADASTLTANARGFHMVNEQTQQTFDCIYNDDSLGLTEPTTKWVGRYNERQNYYFTDNPHSVANVDSGLTYSWTIPLRPYETAVRRVAFGAKGPSYYVSSAYGNDGNVGAYDTPLKTLGAAITKIGNNVGYIYIQDYNELTSTITVPSGANITFMSSDYSREGTPIDDIITIRRNSGLVSGPMFSTNGGTMRFSNLVLDGNRTGAAGNTSPILSADRGTVGIMSGATLQNNQVNAAGMGSAIQISGSADLEMNYGTITGNTAVDRGAVNFDSTGKFMIQNRISIEGNTLSSGEKANVYLSEGKYMTVVGDLDTSAIGVTTARLPEASAGGASTQAAQEVNVAVPLGRSAVDISPSPFVDNFFADRAGSEGTGLYVTSGTAGLSGAGENHDRNTVLKKNGYQITFFIKDADTGGSITGAPSIQAKTYGSGEAVSLAAPPEVTGYEAAGVTIEQGTSNLLYAQLNPGNDYGTVTGIMPNQDVTIDYEYRKVNSSIRFEANGGTPQPPSLTGTAGSNVNAMMPRVSRYGYVFRGWSSVNDWNNPSIIGGLPSVFPETPVTYYAVFEPDPNVKFNYTVEYSNRNGDIVFQSDTEENAYSVETPITAQKKEIHGYAWSLEDSGTTPAEYNYSGTAVPVGQFNGTTGAFAGTMPGQDATVRYRYQVDYGNTAAQSQLTVRHETAGGTTVSEAQTSSHYPEEAVTARPVTRYGYECVDVRIDTGDTADDSDGHLVSALTGSFDADRIFRGMMPNQPVTLTYLYEPTEEGYPLTVEYVDGVTTDSSLKNIREPLVHFHQAEEGVGLACSQSEVVYREPYGYRLASKSIAPSTTLITWSGNDFTGTMPNDSETVTYRHDRNPELWSYITYRAGAHGSLTAEGVSSDVEDRGDGSYRTSVLIDDESEQGAEFGYTLGTMTEKRLVPGTRADQYYRFGGWFVDANSNGIMDDGETLLEEGSRFTGETVLTAYFEEDPEKWVDIHFEAGAHGSINDNEARTLHTMYDRKWSEITESLPQYTAEVNYLTDRWYAGDVPVTGDMNLVNGQTYTIRFRPDPGVFGTEVTQPETLAGLNSQGKGRITVFNTTPGYQYLLTDPSGKILEIIRGNELTGRVVFDNLYPGADYQVYEATGDVHVEIGSQTDSLAGQISDPAQALTPVLETNYQILYDEEEAGKTILVIKPADSDSEYAVLDSSGHVVDIPAAGNGGFKKPSGSPASLTFAGLDYNREYTVVARPLGKTDVTAESLAEKGSVITTDPGAELELPNYIVETQNGEITMVGETSVGAQRYEEAHKGDRVKITADEVNGAGEPFSHWETTIGTAGELGDKTSRREASFIMPDNNVVLTAVYERPKASPSNAAVMDEVRGGSRKETALDPNEIPRLEAELTTEADRELLDVNHADVTYKVVYRKNAVKASESNAIKASGYYETEHEAAYKGAWGLDVLIERYVNGRKVAGAAEPEAAFRTYIQMGKDDVDMLDYQLYEITENPGTGETEAALVTLEYDPEETGGLYAFTAQAGSRYVMIYNRAYRVYFVNQVALPVEYRYRYYFKVRRDEAPSDEYYADEYGQVEEQLDYFVNPDGAEFSYEGWSRSQDSFKEFDPSEPVRRKTYIYAYYKDNVREVDDARQKLEEAIREAIRISDDHFLKLEESGILKEAVEEALEVLDRENPKATAGQLTAALDRLKDKTDPYEKILDDRYNHYDDIQDNGNKGGNKGGGGSGSGTRQNPYNTKLPESYVVGTNGNWVEVSAPEGQERQMAFVLTGGMRLSGMWAWIKYPADGSTSISDRTGWYHFNDKGIMETGWIRDESGDWYYCRTEKEGNFGKMQTGWHHDAADGNWYYLIPSSGVMATGWRKIGEKWYYFETAGAGVYVYDFAKERWNYGGGTGKPLGSMYKNEMTPDGWLVGDDGAWIQ